VYIAYLDDSATRDKAFTPFKVLSAVVMHDRNLADIEVGMLISLVQLIPEEKRDKFEEFHAYELFGGYGVFEGIEQKKRLEAIEYLLGVIRSSNIPIVYGAVNRKALRQKVYASAEPLDICFRICAAGIHNWLEKKLPINKERLGPLSAPESAILISDDCDPKIKATIKSTYRQLRWPLTKFPQKEAESNLWYLHDGMFFGDSKESVGLQLADLCSYFIAKHLEGDTAAEGFYGLIKDHIVYSRVEPEL
jgi:hypothetical protein